MNTTRSYDSRIKVMYLKDDHSTVQGNHFSKYNKECHTHITDTNGSEDKCQDESDRTPQPNSMDSNKIVDQGYKLLLLVELGKSTSMSVKYTETTNTSTFLQDISCCLYKGVSTIVHLLLSLLVSLRNGVLQSSLLVSLQNTPILLSLWNIFLRPLYEDISTTIHIQVKPEIYFYNHVYEDISTIIPIHRKPETTRSWIQSHSSLQPYMKYFYKLITYYMIDYNHSNNTNNFRIQVVGYIMSIKRK